MVQLFKARQRQVPFMLHQPGMPVLDDGALPDSPAKFSCEENDEFPTAAGDYFL
jgi:hypothetical protein